MTVEGKPHPHSFFRDGEETRVVEAVAREGQGISIRSGINGLLVLKSTGSAFYGFHQDEYTQLPETRDRILSTEIECGWQWKDLSNLDEVKTVVPKFDHAWESARTITIETFAKDNSASVQNTMYKMCDQILVSVPLIEAVDYSLPNKHYFEIGKPNCCNHCRDITNNSADLSWHNGLKNTGKDAEVYAPQSNPNGLIQCTVTRRSKAKL